MPREPILIVDDNPGNLKLLKFLLESEDHEVMTAMSGEEALAALRTRRPWLILTDLQMPGMSGLELAKILKADPATRDIVVVAVTAFAMKGDEEKAVDAGFDAYVTKPIDTRALLALVEQLHQRGQPQEEKG